MAQFRGTIQGTRGSTSRLGSKDSGLTVTANGWNIGVKIILSHNAGKDYVRIYTTKGSNNPHDQLIAEYVEEAR